MSQEPSEVLHTGGTDDPREEYTSAVDEDPIIPACVFPNNPGQRYGPDSVAKEGMYFYSIEAESSVDESTKH